MIRSFISRLRPGADFPPPVPEAPFVVIGDIHGRSDLLSRLLGRLEPGLPVICVGDYVDRGEDSAGVLRMLKDRPDIVCLMGNHERMMLDFLSEPGRKGPLWVLNGGLQTLSSFGVGGAEGLHGDAGEAALIRLRDALADAMGAAMVAWVAQRPLIWRSGNVAVVHAAADPEMPIDMQPDKTLIWGHPAFARTLRRDGIWVVHGHTIVDHPKVGAGRISVDTGAFATGRLTAAIVSADGVRFVEA